ncbi:DNA (cytosine-5-)-methyltransferase [Rhizobium leguminosarum]|uniref:DNA (cytosine-5-)-methyltransferase n=1 Tax=Rhizobium leguminosarum TaxID=384 RepID=A0A4Q1TJU3_RHILE|nr:DNA cytosine methyltransferase [Rhizobium leguminosarum]RXT18749.1 DNA (cytosine-5-)-methyltransferase [Rhizobium leguminosarum]
MLLQADHQSVTQATFESDQKAKRSTRGATYPVIDLFAGPGGLGEGFASAQVADGRAQFRSVISIEKDDSSHQTLLLRHFFRHFPEGEAPEEYYDFLSGRITLDNLFSLYPAAHNEARQSALQITLGPSSHSNVKTLISEKLGASEKWALVGGPPCQAYSLVGRSRMMSKPDFEQDERHTLYLEYLRIIVDHRPPVFVMENVKGLLSATIEGKSAINRIVQDLMRPGSAIKGAPKDLTYRLYSLSEEGVADGEVDPRLFVVKAEEYGIPQARHRMFIVGIRSDLKVRPRTLEKLEAPTVKDTIGSLPSIRSALSREKDSFEAWLSELHIISKMNIRRQLNGADYAAEMADSLSLDSLINTRSPKAISSSRYVVRSPNHPVLKSLYDERLGVLTSHEARSHMASDLRRYLYAAMFAQKTGRSPKLADFPEGLLPDHQNVELGRTGKMFSDRFRVQLANQASATITSHISKDGHYFIHYDPVQCRSLTVREAARLQTFPDNYFFSGPRTAQYRQVGNAVPPQLARQIAEIVAEVLASMRGR